MLDLKSTSLTLDGKLSVPILIEGIMHYRCSGGDCELDLPCRRHFNSSKTAVYIKERYQRRIINICSTNQAVKRGLKNGRQKI